LSVVPLTEEQYKFWWKDRESQSLFVRGNQAGKFLRFEYSSFFLESLLTSGSLPRMRFHKILVFPLALAGSLSAQDLKPVADRLASQNASSMSNTNLTFAISQSAPPLR